MKSKVTTYVELLESAEMAAQLGKEAVEDALLAEADNVWNAMDASERAQAAHSVRMGHSGNP